MKILLHGNAPFVPSGYGVQAALFGPRLAGLGHDVAYSANYGLQGSFLPYGDTLIYPADGAWGNCTMAGWARHHARGHLADCLVVALGDTWRLDPKRFPPDLRLAVWAPVDHHPLPAIVLNVLAAPQTTPVAMSRFGERMMRECGLEPLYVPHGVDIELFRPRPGERDTLRELMGVPADAFLVGMVAANSGYPAVLSRKAFPQAFQAFARFRRMFPDAFLYVHTNEFATMEGGINLRPLAESCGIPPTAIGFTEQLAWEFGVRRDVVAGMMSAFDVLLNPSLGEGFGLAIVEAQACGVPVIVTDHSAMPELCGAGWLVEGDDWYDVPQDAWYKNPSVDSIVAALGEAYASAGVMADAARRFALGYDVESVTEEYWVPALEALELGRREVGPLVAA